MSFTAQWNLSASKKLSIFSVSDNKHLTLGTWDESNPGQIVPTNPSDLPAGPIAKGSSIAAVNLQDWTRVFGWAEAKDCHKNGEIHLYMLSPVNQWINGVATKAANTALAAIGTGPTSWIYYVNKSNRIYELNYNGKGTGQSSGTLVNVVPNINSRLAAALSFVAFGEKDRLIAFQQENKELQVYNVSTGTGQTIDGAYPKEGTSLALISYNTAQGPVRSLYFMSSDEPPKLRRSDSVNGKKWQTTGVDIQAGAPTAATSLSAIWSENLQAVILTYQVESGEVFTQQDNK